MLRTNTKKYAQNIEAYLLGQIDGTEFNTKTDTPKEKINFVFDEFDNQDCEYNKRRTPNHQQRFADWLAGLPSAIPIEFTNHGILELARELQELKGEYPKGTQESIIKNYFSFMSYQIHKLQDKINNNKNQ